MAAILYDGEPSDRTCIIHGVTFDWLETNARYMMENERPTPGERHGINGVQQYLDRVLGAQNR